MEQELSAWNRFELRIYRLLGVSQFRRLTLVFEKIIHFNGAQKNENYHPASFDLLSLERHDGYLIYNAFLHCVSLLLTAAYAALSFAISFRSVALDATMIALVPLNLYCIMLQRANYLKLRELRRRSCDRFLSQSGLCREDAIREIYVSSPRSLLADYRVLSRIRDAFAGRSDCVLTSDDAKSLERICACFSPAADRHTERSGGDAPAAGLLEQCARTSGPYTVLQLRADWLQRRLPVSGRRMLARTAIVTEDAECERLYRALIPEDTVYCFCLVCLPLYETYARMVGEVGTDET